MTSCEICGLKTDKIVRALIEGTEMNVCDKCSSYGKILYTPKPAVKIETKSTKNEPEVEERIVDNFAEIMKKTRESRGFTQEEFAKSLNEKVSVIRSLENGNLVPSIALAQKLEKQLGITLIEKISNEKMPLEQQEKIEFTLGDIISIKKRRK